MADFTGDQSSGDAISSVVNGLFNVGSGFLNNYFGKKVSKKEYQRAIELWNMQNEYNKPVNQMARLREAGLNPNLVAGSLSDSVAGSIHAPSKEDLRSPLQGLDLIGSYQDIRQRDAQIQNIKAQTNFIKQQARALGMENDENTENGTSRATPTIERTYRAFTRIGEELGAKFYDLTHRDSSGSSGSFINDVWENTPFYKSYNWLRSKF